MKGSIDGIGIRSPGRRAGRVAAVAAVCSSLVIASRASAESRAERDARAQALYDRGTALMDARDYGAACPLLDAVTHMVPEGVGARLTLASCFEEDGKLASASREYQLAAALAENAGQPERRKRAAAKVEELEPKLGKLEIEVPPGARARADYVVRFDGEIVPEPHWRGLAADRGEHEVALVAGGATVVTKRVHVDDGGRVAVELAPPPKQAAEERRAWQLPLGVSLTVSGLVMVASGFTLGGIALDRSSQAKVACATGPTCSGQALGLGADADAYGAASIGLLVTGALAAGPGIALAATAPRASAPVEVSLGPGSAGLTVHY